MSRLWPAALGLAMLATACVAGAETTVMANEQQRTSGAAPARTAPPAVPALVGPATFVFDGQLTQGGWLRGQAPGGAVAARLGDLPLTLSADGRFFAAFDRDAAPSVSLTAQLGDGRTITVPLTISPRDWQIERVNTPLRPGGATSEAFQRQRAPELARIAAARAQEIASDGWRQDFAWPATGRISGRFGSQRIYRGGEAGSYHSGLDIAGGSGTVYTAPADGVVVLAAQQDFSLEGRLLIIDHGQGLSSAFLHSSALLVREGDRVVRGQPVGRIGATGRATGPHLHWGLVWRGQRLDPLLFLGPMP